jgi:hypothetical protein
MPVNQQKSYTLKLVLLGKSVIVKILEQMLIHFYLLGDSSVGKSRFFWDFIFIKME